MGVQSFENGLRFVGIVQIKHDQSQVILQA